MKLFGFGIPELIILLAPIVIIICIAVHFSRKSKADPTLNDPRVKLVYCPNCNKAIQETSEVCPNCKQSTKTN